MPSDILKIGVRCTDASGVIHRALTQAPPLRGTKGFERPSLMWYRPGRRQVVLLGGVGVLTALQQRERG
jgi:hypothetical protein